MKEAQAPTARMLKLTAISLGLMLLGLLIIVVILVINKSNAANADCDEKLDYAIKGGSSFGNIEDKGKFFLITVLNDNKSSAALVSIDKCSGDELQRITFTLPAK